MSFAEDMLEQLRPLLWDGSRYNTDLDAFVRAFAQPFEIADTLGRDDENGNPGWASLLSPSRCPDELLPWLTQVAGVRPKRGETMAQLRARITDGEQRRRGTPQSIIDRARNVGCVTFRLVERADGNPWLVRMYFKATEHSPQKEAFIKEMVPAGIRVDVQFWSGKTYDDLDAEQTTYNALDAAYPTYDAMEGI